MLIEHFLELALLNYAEFFPSKIVRQIFQDPTQMMHQCLLSARQLPFSKQDTDCKFDWEEVTFVSLNLHCEHDMFAVWPMFSVQVDKF